MIIKEETIEIKNIEYDKEVIFHDIESIYKKAIFFDLEHYIYKKPICIGVFGCCYYNEADNNLAVTQYMIENRREIYDLLIKARDYFYELYKKGKRYIITFSGNNDFTVIKYLFEKYKIEMNFEIFTNIDLQDLFKQYTNQSIGLKNLEKKFNIDRLSDTISGLNLAKTFRKVVKDEGYFNRMPREKIQNILKYNQQDVVSLFYILVTWNKYIQLELENISAEIEKENASS